MIIFHRCIDGYYRPITVSPGDRQPCYRCDCNPYGTKRSPPLVGLYSCVKDMSSADVDKDMLPGTCHCKEGFAGKHCNR